MQSEPKAIGGIVLHLFEERDSEGAPKTAHAKGTSQHPRGRSSSPASSRQEQLRKQFEGDRGFAHFPGVAAPILKSGEQTGVLPRYVHVPDQSGMELEPSDPDGLITRSLDE